MTFDPNDPKTFVTVTSEATSAHRCPSCGASIYVKTILEGPRMPTQRAVEVDSNKERIGR